MCIVLLSLSDSPDDRYSLVLAANRDEMHERASTPLHWWRDCHGIAGGRDRVAGGTWLAVSRVGRFATVLNDPSVGEVAGKRSRGGLVASAIQVSDAVQALERMRETTDQYGGFHLLAGDPTGCSLLSSRDARVRTLKPGIHVVGNAGSREPGPRGAWLRQLFSPAMTGNDPVDGLFSVLADESAPGTGEGDTRPVFIRRPEFGTRCSTVLLIEPGGRVGLHERRFDSDGRITGETSIGWWLA